MPLRITSHRPRLCPGFCLGPIPGRFSGPAIGLALILLGLTPDVGFAAVRSCGPVVSSEIATAATELDAKKKALDQWRAEALKRGPGFDSWRLAADKSLKCFPKDQGFECVAFGAPCIVDQTPKSPASAPGAKGQGI